MAGPSIRARDRAMRHMDRVTLVLCTNATGNHKLPVAMIGEPVNRLCFRGEGNECPLPYFNQKNAFGWMRENPGGKWRSGGARGFVSADGGGGRWQWKKNQREQHPWFR